MLLSVTFVGIPRKNKDLCGFWGFLTEAQGFSDFKQFLYSICLNKLPI